MEKINSTPIQGTSTFLLGALLNTMAVVDMTGLVDYSVKAVIGGIIWLGFKVLSDYIARKSSSTNDQPPVEKFTPKK